MLRIWGIELLVLLSGIPLAVLMWHYIYYPSLEGSLWARDSIVRFSPWWTGVFLVPWIINLVRVLRRRCGIWRINFAFWGVAIGLLISFAIWYRHFNIRTDAFWVLPLPNERGSLWVNFSSADLTQNILLIAMAIVGSITLLIAGFALFNFLGKRAPSQKDTDQQFHADH